MHHFKLPSPEIVIPRLVYEKIQHWVQKGGNHECSGLGITKIIDGKIHIVDAVMLKQKNTGSTTDIDAQAVSEAMFKFRHHEGDLNFWWHSHADMGVFWSGTDTSTIAQIGLQGMCVAIVFNKKREYRAAIACTSPFPFFIDEVKMSFENEISNETIVEWDKEYDESIVKYPQQTIQSNWGHDGLWNIGQTRQSEKDWKQKTEQANIKSVWEGYDESDLWEDVYDIDDKTGRYLMKDGRTLDDRQYANYLAKKEIKGSKNGAN